MSGPEQRRGQGPEGSGGSEGSERRHENDPTGNGIVNHGPEKTPHTDPDHPHEGSVSPEPGGTPEPPARGAGDAGKAPRGRAPRKRPPRSPGNQRRPSTPTALRRVSTPTVLRRARPPRGGPGPRTHGSGAPGKTRPSGTGARLLSRTPALRQPRPPSRTRVRTRTRSRAEPRSGAGARALSRPPAPRQPRPPEPRTERPPATTGTAVATAMTFSAR